jgi:hypothetical protein
VVQRLVTFGGGTTGGVVNQETKVPGTDAFLAEMSSRIFLGSIANKVTAK